MRLRSFGPAWREAELDRKIARLAAEHRRSADVEGGTAPPHTGAAPPRRTPALAAGVGTALTAHCSCHVTPPSAAPAGTPADTMWMTRSCS
jgi:hypothetical protein